VSVFPDKRPIFTRHRAGQRLGDRHRCNSERKRSRLVGFENRLEPRSKLGIFFEDVDDRRRIHNEQRASPGPGVDGRRDDQRVDETQTPDVA